MPVQVSLAEARAVLFDVDGTLVDSLGMIIPALTSTYAKFLGVSLQPEQIRVVVGMPMAEQARLFAQRELTEQEIETIVADAVTGFEEHRHLETDFVPALEALKMIYRAGIRTALVTSKTATEVDHFLRRFSGATSVDTAVSASDVKHPKPSPESALLACQRLEVQPHQAIMIGDSVFDIRCAKDAGVMSVAVAYGAGDEASLREEKPDLLLHTPEDLLAWVQEGLAAPTWPARSK